MAVKKAKTAKKKATPKQIAARKKFVAQKKFVTNKKKKIALVKSGKARNMKSAWKKIK